MSKEPEPPPQTTDLSRDKLLADLREVVEFQGRMIELRPIRASDEPAHEDFFNSLDRQDVRFRFFGLVQHPQHDQLIRFTQIDYDEEMAFVAAEIDPPRRTLGVARAVLDTSKTTAEFAVVVRSSLKGNGLGRLLLVKLIDYFRAIGTRELVGQVMEDNVRMLALARSLGFGIRSSSDDIHEVVLRLNDDQEGKRAQ